jgi:putative FmdB family regulatory protein
VPIYAYKCSSCGHAQDSLQKLSAAPLTTCPVCHQETYVKQVTAAGFQLKGSGWYVTDFRNNGGSAGAAAASGASSSKDANGSDSASAGEASSASAASSPDATGSSTAAATPSSSGPAAPAVASSAPKPSTST